MPTSTLEYQRLFNEQKANQYAVGATTAHERIQKLKKLEQAIRVTYREAIYAACLKDLGKNKAETDLSEVYSAVSEARHAIEHLHRWMGKHRVKTPMSLLGSSSWIKYEPKGVCLLFSPWNLPFNLTLGPLASAIAAGNTVVIKPSELTPHSSALIKEMIETLFPENEVAVIEGGIAEANALLELPFNHIFFTGSPAVGKIVMAAAARHLSSVTLELGGKSPTIVDESADVSMAARRIAWGKFNNNGQLCLAPDYVFVHHSKKEAFLEALKGYLDTFYGSNPQDSPDFARFVNQKNFERVKAYLDDAISKGAIVLHGGASDLQARYMAPTIVEQVSFESTLMQNEIFGPVLPVFTYENLDEVIRYLQNNERPLAMYIYSSNKQNIKKLSQYTRTGGTCINHNVVHFFQLNLPFGGSNNSGIGRGHGFYGFQAFSNERGFFKQEFPGALELLTPPYTSFKQKLIDLTVKWF